MHSLLAQPRDKQSRSVIRQLRASGRIPAVVYGKRIKNTPLSVEEGDFSRLLRDHGNHAIIRLSWDNQQASVIIGEVQTHPIKDQILHVDFQEVNMDKKMKAEIPIEWIGEENIQRQRLVLQKQTHSLEVECMPADLPETLKVNVGDLEIGKSISVTDLDLGEGIEATTEADTVLASVLPPTLQTDPDEPQLEEKEPEIVDAKDGPGIDEAK